MRHEEARDGTAVAWGLVLGMAALMLVAFGVAIGLVVDAF